MEQPLHFIDPFGLDGWGNDFADWADRRIEYARLWWLGDQQDWVRNGSVHTVADISFGFADMFRVGSGVGGAIYCDVPDYRRLELVSQDVVRGGGLFLTMAGPFAGRVGGTGGPGRNLDFPDSPGAMDDILGFQGRPVPDGPTTPGRRKVVWQPSDHIKITFEQHPYHPNAPAYHKGPHWHVDTPGARHTRYLPGQPFPGQ